MTPIPRDPTGSHPLVNWCKQISKCVRERTIINYHNGDIDRTSDGVRLKGRLGGGAGGGSGGTSVVEIDRYTVVTVVRNVLLCRQVSDSSNGDYTPIAKPFELDPDRAKGDGDTAHPYTYPPSNGTPSEIAATTRWRTSRLSTESVYPAYASGSVIFAMRGSNAGTGVTYNGTAVEWQDMNVDGRIFLTDLNTYEVCSQGVFKLVQIRGTNPRA